MNKLFLSLLATASVFATGAFADETGTATVQSTAVVYDANGYSSGAQGGGGTAPGFIALAPGATNITFNASGSISLNIGTGSNFNDADGIGSASDSVTNGVGPFSTISLPNAGALTGVFIDTNTFNPTGSAPASLDFTGAGGTGFTTLSAGLNQVFFIGDGLTGDGTGTTQDFVVPTGATELYLGIADAGGYHGTPGSYGDNTGTFSVSYDITSPSSVPEAANTLGLLAIVGASLLFFVRRRKLAVARAS